MTSLSGLDEFRRTLTAAAIPIGAVIRIRLADGFAPAQVTVAKVVNGDPLPGWLTLTDEAGRVWHLGGSERVSVVSLP